MLLSGRHFETVGGNGSFHIKIQISKTDLRRIKKQEIRHIIKRIPVKKKTHLVIYKSSGKICSYKVVKVLVILLWNVVKYTKCTQQYLCYPSICA